MVLKKKPQGQAQHSTSHCFWVNSPSAEAKEDSLLEVQACGTQAQDQRHHSQWHVVVLKEWLLGHSRGPYKSTSLFSRGLKNIKGLWPMCCPCWLGTDYPCFQGRAQGAHAKRVGWRALR